MTTFNDWWKTYIADPGRADLRFNVQAETAALDAWEAAQAAQLPTGWPRASRGQAPAPAAVAEPVAYLWQHSETGCTRVVMTDAVITADATWRVVGPLVLASAPKAAPARWYMINAVGMATLCADRQDAEQEAADAQAAWPHMGPHRAAQLVEVGDCAAKGGDQHG